MCKNKTLLSILLLSFTFNTGFADENAVNLTELYGKHQVIIKVPSTLHSLYMPPLPELTKSRLLKRKMKKSATTEEALTLEDEKIYEEKYAKAMKVLVKDGTFARIEEISKLYNIKPIHVAGAIIGEHTFNVDILDTVQNYFAFMYKGWLKYFDSNRTKFNEFLKIPEIQVILNDNCLSDSERWTKIGSIYETKYRGKDGYPDGNFLMSFFNPLGSGKSYGLGQLSPLRVLMANDVAHNLGQVPYVDVFNTDQLYKCVLDRDLSIHYICATIWVEINCYKENANFDLSDNPGMTATLYNIGFEKSKSIELFKKNMQKISKNQSIIYPEENYYGWYVNYKRNDIEKAFLKNKVVKN